MDRFFSSPRSPAVDTPMCDSDEEVFFGPVTSKELQKASQLRRQTQLFFPSFDWKPSISPLAQELDAPMKPSGVTTNVCPNYSADSLESDSYITSSEKPEESSKENYSTALSGNSLNLNSQVSLNDAVMVSKFSEDSLESDQTQDATEKREDSLEAKALVPAVAPSLYSNISDDSLDESSNPGMNVARIQHRELSDNSEQLSRKQSQFSDSSSACRTSSLNVAKLANVTYSASENSFNNYPAQNSNLTQNETFLLNSGEASVTAYEAASDIEKNNTYNVGNESYLTIDLGEPSDTNIDLPKEVVGDEDGGFLSILSEAALYHASQLKESGMAQAKEMEESTSTTQSLEDRFKVFGIEAEELEDQQLSNSIMYITGRESHLPSSEAETNTFYTGKNSDNDSSVKSFEVQRISTTVESLTDVSAVSSQISADFNRFGTVNTTSESQESVSDCLQYSNGLNHCIENGTLGSALSAVPDSASQDASFERRDFSEDASENDSLNDSNSYARESSEISGICELKSLSENQRNSLNEPRLDDDAVLNDSNASSYCGEMNDTIEEYEMMMRYGVDYILGRKGNKKRSESASAVEEDIHSRGHQINERSPMHDTVTGNNYLGDLKSLSPADHQQNSSTSSVEYLDAMEVSPNDRRTANIHIKDYKVLSPLHRQVLRRTPQKNTREAPTVSRGSAQKIPSKLPRVATVAPSKSAPATPCKVAGTTPSKALHTPPHQNSRQFSQPALSETKVPGKVLIRPVTPASEAKSSLFKKPVTPAVAGSRIPKTVTPQHCLKSNSKILEKIQSPVGAYIHNSPSPVLVTNIKAKMSDRAPFEKEMHARAVWRAGELKSCTPKSSAGQVANAENMNPNIGCGLPAVKYTKAPCIKLDENSKLPIPRGERIAKLLDVPSPQVIKHEGRLRVNCGSPQLAAKMQAMADTFEDSMLDIHSVSGDISVCVSQQATRTNTLGH